MHYTPPGYIPERRGAFPVPSRSEGAHHDQLAPPPPADGRHRLRLLRSLLKILAAGAAMYAVARTGVALLGPGSGSADRLVILALVGSASLGAYAAVALLLKMEEPRSVGGLLGRRSSKKGS